jgi:hypothetical protein
MNLRVSALLIYYLLVCLSGGCGDGDSPFGNRVVFVNPDEISAPGVAAAAGGVVKLSLYGHNGTGFFISGTGYLLTNHHVAGGEVCAEDCPGLRVIANKQRGKPQVTYQGARLIFSDEDLDMALLKVDAGSDTVDFVKLGNYHPDQPVEAEWTVTVVGHPFAALKKSTQGVIDFRNDEVYIINAFVFPGNSGSPLLDSSGKALGLVQAIYYWIGDINLKGEFGYSGVATTIARILEKYPFLTELNVIAPTAETEDQLAQAVGEMTDGRPVSLEELMATQTDSLVRADVDAVLSRLAHLDEEWAFQSVVDIWERVLDRDVFEESHRYDAARAMYTLAGTPEEIETVYQLLSVHTPTTDESWRESYLWLINRLQTEEAVVFSQDRLVELYIGYRLNPALAAIFLAYGIRSLDSIDLLQEIGRLVDDSTYFGQHYIVADYLDSFRFQSTDDETQVEEILEDIREKSDRLRGIFKAEQALYNRGRIDLD